MSAESCSTAVTFMAGGRGSLWGPLDSFERINIYIEAPKETSNIINRSFCGALLSVLYCFGFMINA